MESVIDENQEDQHNQRSRTVQNSRTYLNSKGIQGCRGPGILGNPENVQRRLNDVENYAAAAYDDSTLRFHAKCGGLVALSNGFRSAERKRPFDEFNNGVVMSNKPLELNEMFEIRIDRLVDKWSGSIEVGITTHNPNVLNFPATMTSMRSGTIMMSGTAILTNGKGTLRVYGNFNLDELKEGDRIGMLIKEGRDLYYYINGIEQGVASSAIPEPVWAVVDLYGMTVKVSIGDEVAENDLANAEMRAEAATEILPIDYEEENTTAVTDINRNPLLFDSICGSYAEVINCGRTAHRPNSGDDFNNGVVLSNRPLLSGEIFEVRLDKLVGKWAGSLEIGVTTYSAAELDFPSTMTNVRSGTWLLTSSSVTNSGTTVLETYPLNLDQLKIGDRVGVARKADGTLHFYLNAIDKGPAVTNVPDGVYGVVDLYGQASQVTISYPSFNPMNNVTNAQQCSSDLKFHHRHGRNVRVIRGGSVAQRPNATLEFNDSIVMSNRPLEDNEIFEVVIESVVDRWSGSLEAGMTAIAPDQISFPSTMTDIDYDTWMLSGSSVMRNGATVTMNYACDLDSLPVGTRIGMMRGSDATLHYYVNGEDRGVACSNLKPGLWAVIDLYGQCAQVSIVQNRLNVTETLVPNINVSTMLVENNGTQNGGTQPNDELHKFSKCCGSNVVLAEKDTTATRVRHFSHGLVFSSSSLQLNELFEVKIEKLNSSFSGSLHIGLTTLPISNNYPTGGVPSTLAGLENADTWWVDESTVRRNSSTILKLNYCPSLARLVLGDRVGVKRTPDNAMRIFINGEDFGPAAQNICRQQIFAVVEIFGAVESVSTSSFCLDRDEFLDALSNFAGNSGNLTDINDRGEKITIDFETTWDNLEGTGDHSQNSARRDTTSTFHSIPSPTLASPIPIVNSKFHEKKGRNISLSRDRNTATRIDSFNHGIVFSSSPLKNNSVFQVRMGALDPRWTSSLMIGVVGDHPDYVPLPKSAFDIKKNCWLICGESVFFNGVKIKGCYGPNLDALSTGITSHLIGVYIDVESRLHLMVNGVDQGIAAKEIPKNPYCVVDLYGQCKEIFIQHEGESLNSNVTVSISENTHSISQQKKVKCTTAPTMPPHSLHHNLNVRQQNMAAQSSNETVQSANVNMAMQNIVQSAVENKALKSTNANTALQYANANINEMNPNDSTVESNATSTAIPNSNAQLSETFPLPPSQMTQLPFQSQPILGSRSAARDRTTLSSNDDVNTLLRDGLTPASGIDQEPTTDEKKCKNNSGLDSESSREGSKNKEKNQNREIKNCEYQNTCARFKKWLAIPDSFFNHLDDLCFCQTCHKVRGEPEFHVKGNPPRQYAQPIGWCRFSLVSSVGTNNESWHMAYHGTDGASIRRILDKGELLFESEMGINTRLPDRKNKEDASDGSFLTFSPSISHASRSSPTPQDSLIAPTMTYFDQKSQRNLRMKTVIQVAVEPGSYKVNSGEEDLGSQLLENSIEWVTKERGATQLLALLVSLEGIN